MKSSVPPQSGKVASPQDRLVYPTSLRGTRIRPRLQDSMIIRCSKDMLLSATVSTGSCSGGVVIEVSLVLRQFLTMSIEGRWGRALRSALPRRGRGNRAVGRPAAAAMTSLSLRNFFSHSLQVTLICTAARRMTGFGRQPHVHFFILVGAFSFFGKPAWHSLKILSHSLTLALVLNTRLSTSFCSSGV